MLGIFGVLLSSDLNKLLTFTSYMANVQTTVGLSTVLYFRWKYPDVKRTFRVPLMVPIAVLIFQIAVPITAPLITNPYEAGMCGYVVLTLILRNDLSHIFL